MTDDADDARDAADEQSAHDAHDAQNAADTHSTADDPTDDRRTTRDRSHTNPYTGQPFGMTGAYDRGRTGDGEDGHSGTDGAGDGRPPSNDPPDGSAGDAPADSTDDDESADTTDDHPSHRRNGRGSETTGTDDGTEADYAEREGWKPKRATGRAPGASRVQGVFDRGGEGPV